MLDTLNAWTPPPHWPQITTLDTHTAGEPLRIVTGGFPSLPGADVLARRRHARAHFDHLRTALMWEPRGHREMYGCLITPPVTPTAHFGVLFLHNEGYSTMCGHAIIALGHVAVTTGLVRATPPATDVRIDTPAGLVHARVAGAAQEVTSVSFQNVPSYVAALDDVVAVPGYGRIRFDLAFGGAYYAYVQADQVGLACLPEDYHALVEAGMAIKRAVMASRTIVHPFEPDLGYLYGTIFVAPPQDAAHHSRNVCIFADGQVDRSPTGTGVSGRVAIHHARGDLAGGAAITVESILGTCFTGRVVRTTSFGPHAAVVPEVTGQAHIMARSTFVIDPDDPLRHGFIL